MLLGTVLALATGMSSPASGNVKVRFDNGLKSEWTEDAKVPKVTVNYGDVSPEWSKSPEDWAPGKKVTATITISGDFVKSDCSVYGGELLSVKADNGETTIKASYVPVAQLGAPEWARWSDSAKTKAAWKKVPYASKYQLRLYRGDASQWVKTLTTSSNVADLVEYLEDGSSYYYEVRAIAKNSSEEQYLKDGEYTVSDDSVIQELGDTSGRWSNTRSGWRYRDEDENYVTSCWKMINGKWYYFNQDGYALTGWQSLDNKWYYMDANAQMQTGWRQLNGKWYFFRDSGDMATGWIETQPRTWYYLYEDGSLAVNTVIDGTYTVDGSGQWTS